MFLPLILTMALLLRVSFAWSYTSHHSKQALGVIPFLFESGNISYSLAIGNGFSSPFHTDTGPTAWMTPIYPLLIAAVFRVFGVYTFHGFEAAVLLNILFSTLCCIPIYLAGKRMGGAALGAGAAWLWAIFPNAILIPVESMWDASLAALLAATILWATLALDDSRRKRDWCAYGLLWGVALMATATLASLLPLLLGWLVYRARRESRPWLKMPATALAIAILCCVPWTIRNYAVFHSFVPLRSTLGLQLWVGNNPQAKPIWLGDFHPIHDENEREKYIAAGEIAYMREKRDDAIRFMFTHPRKEAYLVSERFIEVWSGGTPDPWQDFLRDRSFRFRAVLIANILVAFAALLGIIELARRRSVYAFPLAIGPVVFPWAYYLTVVMPRYRLPIDPAVLLLTAIAIGAFCQRFRRTQPPYANANLKHS